jgi:hypothetical protein
LKGFAKSLYELSSEADITPVNVLNHIKIYEEFVMSDVVRPEFANKEEMGEFIVSSFFGINDCKKLSVNALAGMFDVDQSVISKFIKESDLHKVNVL